jgi:gamma-glutamylcyclotransferase (GGCT)/AIG2-like uncharacterized protein YtfP
VINVFVYGTLKPGEVNYQKYCQGKVVEAKKAMPTASAANALGQLYSLPMGYPAMTLGNSKVYGYLLSFADSQILTALDNLEDYQPTKPISDNLYNRQSIEIFDLDGLSLGWVWVYLMTLERVYRLGGKLQPNGYWHSQHYSF